MAKAKMVNCEKKYQPTKQQEWKPYLSTDAATPVDHFVVLPEELLAMAGPDPVDPLEAPVPLTWA